MAKRVVSSLGIHKKKHMKHNKKKTLFKKIIDFLKSDGYMYAPLVFSQPFNFSPPKAISTTSTGFERKNPFEENNKNLMRKDGEYLKSDYYMYAPLVVHPPSVSSDSNKVSPPRAGPVWYSKRAARAIPVEKVVEKTNQKAKWTENGVGEEQHSSGHLPASTVVRQTLSYRETLKHIIHQNCRSSSVPGSLLETEPRKLVVE